jgi:hypothetical protein
VSQSFGYIPKSGIAGSNGRSMFREESLEDLLDARVEERVWETLERWGGPEYQGRPAAGESRGSRC